MKLIKLLKKQKSKIINDWVEMVLNSYPPDTAQFYKGQFDQFANPVGDTTRKSLNSLLDELFVGPCRSRIMEYLDPILRIRAVQDLSPVDALSFLPNLKRIIRSKLRVENQDLSILHELLEFELRIDEMSMIGFEIYIKCKEQISNLRVSTERNKIYSAFSRAGLIAEVSDDHRDPEIS